MSGRVIGQGWAILHHDGRLFVDANHGASEADCWRIALGWPTKGEVQEQQAKGSRAAKVLIVEAVEAEPGPNGMLPCRLCGKPPVASTFPAPSNSFLAVVPWVRLSCTNHTYCGVLVEAESPSEAKTLWNRLMASP